MCPCCIIVMQTELNRLNIVCVVVKMGHIVLPLALSAVQYRQLQKNLIPSGMKLLEDNDQIIVEQIKNEIIHLICHAEAWPETKFSDYISQQTGYDYTYLANVFARCTGHNIQQSIILQKIARTKELIIHDKLNFSQIAFRLGYCDVAYLSRKFKGNTGYTLTQFRKKVQKRNGGSQNV